MPYESTDQLPEAVREKFQGKKLAQYLAVWNQRYKDKLAEFLKEGMGAEEARKKAETAAFQTAWGVAAKTVDGAQVIEIEGEVYDLVEFKRGVEEAILKVAESGEMDEEFEEVNYRGIPIVIETPVGGQREWDGEETLPHAPWPQVNWSYGFIPDTISNEPGEELDVYLGPFENDEVYLAMIEEDDGGLDEMKVMVGFADMEDARKVLDFVYREMPHRPKPELIAMSIPDFLESIAYHEECCGRTSPNTANVVEGEPEPRDRTEEAGLSSQPGTMPVPMRKVEILSVERLMDGFEKLQKWSDEAREASAEARRGGKSDEAGSGKAGKDNSVVWSRGAGGFARDYMGNLKDADGSKAAAFHEKYETVPGQSKRGFAGSGRDVYQDRTTGERFVVGRSASGKGFYGTDHSISKESGVVVQEPIKPVGLETHIAIQKEEEKAEKAQESLKQTEKIATHPPSWLAKEKREDWKQTITRNKAQSYRQAAIAFKAHGKKVAMPAAHQRAEKISATRTMYADRWRNKGEGMGKSLDELRKMVSELDAAPVREIQMPQIVELVAQASPVVELPKEVVLEEKPVTESMVKTSIEEIVPVESRQIGGDSKFELVEHVTVGDPGVSEALIKMVTGISERMDRIQAQPRGRFVRKIERDSRGLVSRIIEEPEE